MLVKVGTISSSFEYIGPITRLNSPGISISFHLLTLSELKVFSEAAARCQDVEEVSNLVSEDRVKHLVSGIRQV